MMISRFHEQGSIQKKFFLSAAHSLIVTYTSEESQVNRWITDHIIKKNINVIGFDTETRPNFIKGFSGKNRVATIQLAVRDGNCLVYHIIKDPVYNSKNGFTSKNPVYGCPALTQILSDEDIKKIGVAIDEDAKILEYHYALKVKYTIDISKAIREYKIMIQAMMNETQINSDETKTVIEGQESDTIDFAANLGILNFAKIGMAGIIQGLNLPLKKSKKIATSNWEAFPLNENQLKYAAADAWVVVLAHQRLCHQLKSHPFPENYTGKILSIL